MIPFNVPTLTGNELDKLKEVVELKKFSGDGSFTMKCNTWIQDRLDCYKSLLTTSCTHALEISALLAEIKAGDEVIMPSFTFVSTANAFVLRGAKIRFVDIRQDTLNIDESLIEQAITSRTKAIVPVHYAGVSCEMDVIMDIASKHRLIVVEDAAQGLMSSYKGKKLGTIGDLGCFSFHETKNFQCGEGGALLINDEKYRERAEIIREKGTDRSKFLRGQVDKYSWVSIGSSYLLSEINAAFLLAQLEKAEEIHADRLNSWNYYFQQLKELAIAEKIRLPNIPQGIQHNAHIFHIRTRNMDERNQLIQYLSDHGIQSVFHYVPLHSSKAGQKYGSFIGEDRYTTSESEKLLRLPLFYGITKSEIDFVCSTIYQFYRGQG